jgi:hypothetical protein
MKKACGRLLPTDINHELAELMLLYFMQDSNSGHGPCRLIEISFLFLFVVSLYLCMEFQDKARSKTKKKTVFVISSRMFVVVSLRYLLNFDFTCGNTVLKYPRRC